MERIFVPCSSHVVCNTARVFGMQPYWSRARTVEWTVAVCYWSLRCQFKFSAWTNLPHTVHYRLTTMRPARLPCVCHVSVESVSVSLLSTTQLWQTCCC